MSRSVVPIGLLISRRGSYGAVGDALYRGATLAISEVNADASFPITFEPRAVEPNGRIEDYVSGAQSLLMPGDLIHVVGCYTSSSRKEVLPIFEKHDGLLWYPSHYEGFETSENVVYTGAAPNQHVVPLVHYMQAHQAHRVYMVGSNYIWAWENNRIMRELLGRSGGSVVGERYVPIGELDLDEIISIILTHRPDFVFNTLIGESAYEFYRRFRMAAQARGIDQPREIPVVSCSLAEPELAMIGAACDGHISSSVYFSTVDTEENHRFLDAWAAQGDAPGLTSADAEAAYIAVHLLARAIVKAGDAALGPVLEAVGSVEFRAPQGPVRVDAENRHCYLWPRIGRSRRDGTFDILHESPTMVRPDPYLVWEQGGQRGTNAFGAHGLRIVS